MVKRRLYYIFFLLLLFITYGHVSGCPQVGSGWLILVLLLNPEKNIDFPLFFYRNMHHLNTFVK
jgi:hypothetical protein